MVMMTTMSASSITPLLVLLGLNNTKVERQRLAAAAWIAGGRRCEWAGTTGASPSS